ncbi:MULTISPECIES: hypothetical protein [unclassified Sphingomonas]|uniref:hypothetical protein n=1 Tax=unclassified Sphingomonas TaxID=196159 RepID=UPI0006F256AC|nr:MULTISPECIES: hypothetical protein [unclassified Sphingomonas]KQM28425.1 hypothetical protein ASE58_00540 [Sphingomonas sp. Leaf9]KQM45131.1 hypothetical protein ASE57_00540 [Sphingomonas sp. Leaf11]
MNWGGPGFVLAIIAMAMIAGVVKASIRAKHGIAKEDERVRGGNPDAERQAWLMAQQNEQLQAKVLRLEERIAVLERIATDPATRTAREIDALR